MHDEELFLGGLGEVVEVGDVCVDRRDSRLVDDHIRIEEEHPKADLSLTTYHLVRHQLRKCLQREEALQLIDSRKRSWGGGGRKEREEVLEGCSGYQNCS